MRWTYTPPSAEEVEAFSQNAKFSRVMAELLLRNGHRDPVLAETFLEPTLASLGDPFILPNLEAAASRLRQAVLGNEAVVVLGDYDVDGVSSTTLLVGILRRFGLSPRFVVPRRANCGLSLLVSAGLDSVALRAPAHPLARDLLARFGGPIAAPSANAAGEVSPTTADHVARSLGRRIDLILDGGACAVGLESTVIDLCGDRPALLRHGAITLEQLEAVLGAVDDATRPVDGAAPRSPGQIARHYAPSIPVRLNANKAAPDEALLGFGPDCPNAAQNLSPTGDLTEAAANLFAALRALDRPEYRAIAVMPIPDTGLGRAINDRLRRSAKAHNG